MPLPPLAPPAITRYSTVVAPPDIRCKLALLAKFFNLIENSESPVLVKR
jgi:hypothetical protein